MTCVEEVDIFVTYAYIFILCVGFPTSNPVAFLFLCSLRDPPPVSPVNFWLKRPSRRSPRLPCPPHPLPLPPACVEGLSSCTRIARSPTHWTVPVLTTVAAPVCLPALSPAYSPACRPSSSWPPLQPPPARPHANVSAVLVVLLPRAHSAYMNQERAEQFWSFPLVCCWWIAACLISILDKFHMHAHVECRLLGSYL